MSYILDALRRAEADRERERGQVPGLHTRPLSGDAPPATGPRRWLPWAGGGLLLLAGLGAGVWMTSGPRQAIAPEPLPAALPAPQPAPAPAPVQTAVIAPPPQPVASAASPYLPPVPPPAAVVAAPAPVAEAPLPRMADLPEATRRELPKLAISGSVYSDDPGSRFVIVNGEVQREGAKLGADLVLEQIGARELVLRYKGQRYRLPV